MKHIEQDNKVCLFYVTERLIKITKESDRRKMEKLLEEFKEECLHNLGINALHNRKRKWLLR